MNNVVYTIGYSGFKMEEYLKVLKENHIDLVIDVRSYPYSKYYTEYNKENLLKILNYNRIYYRNYVSEFGARQTDKIYYPKGYLDFNLFTKSDAFKSGLKKLINSMELGYRFALMCAEKDPLMCHRCIMVSRVFSDLKYPVIHLMPDNNNQTQMDIEQRLLDMFFPNRNQLSFFSTTSSDEELINQAYDKQNEKIGYKWEEL